MRVLKKKIYVAGHTGLVGSSIVRELQKSNAHVELVLRSSCELDLTDQKAVSQFFMNEKIDEVYLAAAKVGGIVANNRYPAEFLYTNLMIQANVIDSAFKAGVRKLLFLGSSCVYPKHSKQPIREDELLSGKLEPTNEPYAIAKIAGIKLCESYMRQYGAKNNLDFRSLMPCNIYGPGDDFKTENSHVIPALIRRFHEAKINNDPVVSVWGSGKPRREFLYVDDLAKACVHMMAVPKTIFHKHVGPMQSHLNIGIGEDVTIKELAELVCAVVGYEGCVVFDESKPDGTPQKVLNIEIARRLGWEAKMELVDGLRATYESVMSS